MASMESKDEVFVMVLVDLSGICRKPAEHSVMPIDLRMRARQFAEEFDALSPHFGSCTPAQHAHGEELLFKITRFLPDVLGMGTGTAILAKRNAAS